MSTHKKIAWESWNAKVCELLEEVITTETQEEKFVFDESAEIMNQDLLIQQPKMLYTPLGVYPESSHLKPSDRWDCWICHTNFPITNSITEILESEISGIEALKILGKYSFFIGVGKLFEISNIRRDIEEALCVYTEDEVLQSPEMRVTVDLVREQLESKNYWSMFVSPEGKVDYVVSDEMDRAYLDGLNNLLELKNTTGGIVLRGNNG
tara:strand:+ start:776 stop:1402 length:627 start_codon:yes stop_codon:yes gene_type:complete